MSVADQKKEMRKEIKNRIETMRINGNPDWLIRKWLIEKGYPEELVDEFGLDKNKALSSISEGFRVE